MLTLKDSNFTVKNGKVYLTNTKFKGKQGLVMFHVDWCGHCKRAKPEFELASDAMGTVFPIGGVDCDANPKVTKALKIEGYPTIKHIEKDGRVSDNYTGERKSNAILSEICNRSRICR